MVIGIGLFVLLTKGMKLGIDFTGGTVQEYTNITQSEQLESVIKSLDGEISYHNNVATLRTHSLTASEESKLISEVARVASGSSLLSSETVGPTLGAELLRKTLIAAVLGVLGIMGYLTYSFGNSKYALAAIGALIHDLLVLIGMYALLGALFGAEANALFVTALLTTMSFSVHDTIIIFDKIREMRGQKRSLPIEEQADIALNQTLVRSFNNSMSALFMLTALLFIGNISIKFFLAALAIGTITGTYSSPFVAVPLLVWLEKNFKKK